MKESNVVLCAPVRTAIGTYGGTLKAIPAPDLGATAIAESLRRSGLTPDDVQSVVLGQVVQAGARMNPARQAAIHAGLPVSVPAMTVNRVCGSGAQAVINAAQEVMLGHRDCAIAGGMENMRCDEIEDKDDCNAIGQIKNEGDMKDVEQTQACEWMITDTGGGGVDDESEKTELALAKMAKSQEPKKYIC